MLTLATTVQGRNNSNPCPSKVRTSDYKKMVVLNNFII